MDARWQPRTAFIGRRRELAEAQRLLGATRLLTLTGPGGCGKTRLAIALATRARDAFPDGVHVVSLATIRDPSLVPVSVARALGLQDARGEPVLEHLRGSLGDREILLVLDNFEQVLPAAAFVSQLLTACPRLRILVTSRSPLHVTGEQEFPVPPLPVPERGSTASTASLARFESLQLFAARAAASVPGFRIDDRNAEAISGIVRRLDGLPLAIELAAARVKLLPPEALRERLDRSLGLLVSTDRDVPDRQRTLLATMSWSHDLLSGDARRLLAAVSVFRGGAALESIEAVCAAGPALDVPVLDAIDELVDQSLLRLTPPAPSPRYEMLETVREFAGDRLAEMPERAAIRAAHAGWFRALTDGLARPPCWPGRAGLDLLELEHDNLRAALDWYGREDPAAGLGMAVRMTGFWSARGHFSEGRRRLTELLEAGAGDAHLRLEAANGVAWLATDQGDHASAIELLGVSIARARTLHDVVAEGTARLYRGRATLTMGQTAGTRADLAQALEALSTAGDRRGAAAALLFSALSAQYSGRAGLACRLLERCVTVCEELALPSVGARAWQLLGIARLEVGDLPGARAAFETGAPSVLEIGDRFGISVGLSGLAGLAASAGRSRSALRLAGAAAAYEATNRIHRPQPLQTSLEQWLAPALASAGPAAQNLLEEGRRMTAGEAVALALADEVEEAPRTAPSSVLTRREREIAALVAVGMTNREIAGRLYLSVRTVEAHVDHILSKLGLHNRTRLASWAAGEGAPAANT